MTPQSIVERHEKYPGATVDLIASFGYQCYRAAINDLLNNFSISTVAAHVESNVSVIIIRDNDLKEWMSGSRCKWKFGSVGAPIEHNNVPTDREVLEDIYAHYCKHHEITPAKLQQIIVNIEAVISGGFCQTEKT